MKKRKGKGNTDKNADFIDVNDNNVQPKKPELSQEERQARLALEGMLLEKREDLIKNWAEREKKKKKEIVELRSNQTFTIGEIQRIVSVDPMPYEPLFSYKTPFFMQMYRMYTPDRDYREYPKPFSYGTLFKDIIYSRLDKSVFQTLKSLNPILTDKHMRKHRLFQNLNHVGQGEVVGYGTDASNIAETLNEGQYYEFRKKLHEEHGVGYQINIFE